MFKKSQYKYNSLISTLLVAGILIVFGLISVKLYFRADLTKNKEFTISGATKDTLKNLDDVVNIKAYFSDKLPADSLNVKQETKDVLDEYKNYAHGNLNVEFIDPKDDQSLQAEARNYGIPELQFSNLEKDKYEVSKGYLGLVVLYADRKETIPAIQGTSTMEYDLTAAIKKVVRVKPLTVRFLTGHGEADTGKDITAAYGYLAKLYDVSTIDISDGNLISEDVTTIIIAGPTEQFSARDKYIIDQFLMNGGNLLVLDSGVKVGDMLQASENATGLEDLVENYGIKINKDLVVDPYCEMAQFSSGYSKFITQYPFWPSIQSGGFNKGSAITSKSENLILPWASSIDIIDGKLSGNKVDRLVMSSGKSWLMKDSFNISPDKEPSQGEAKQSIMAVSISGKFESYFKDKAIPEKEKKEGNAGSEPSADQPEKDKKLEIENGRIIVVGNSRFIEDGFLSRFPDNITFFQNSLDAVTMDEALISIRSRAVSSRPLKSDISDGTKSAIKLLNIFGVSLLLVIFGIVRWAMRRKTDVVY